MSENDDYHTLRAKWYKKLKEEGFQDIEAFSAKGEAFDLLRGGRFFKDPIKIQDDFEYYRAASHFLYDYKWPCDKHKIIWEGHTKGETRLEISARTGYTPKSIEWIIIKYRRILKEGAYDTREESDDRQERGGRSPADRSKRRSRLRSVSKKDAQYNKSRSKTARDEIERDDSRPPGIETFGILFASYSRRR